MKRLSWSQFITKDDKKLYGPDHFKAILRAQNIDPYELDLVTDIDLSRIVAAAKEEGFDTTDVAILMVFSEEKRKKELQKIYEIVKEYIGDYNTETILNYWFVYMLHLVSIETQSEPLTEGMMIAISNMFNEAQLSWGAQHAYWHMLSNGPNTEIGEKLYRSALQRMLDMKMDNNNSVHPQ